MRQRGKSKQVYCRPPGPPPHTAAEAPAGHGLDPALWTSLTLASDLNIWQQADKGCSGNSLCCCQQPHPLHCPARGLHIHTFSFQLRAPAPLSLLTLCFSQSLSPLSFSFPLPLPFLRSFLLNTPHPAFPSFLCLCLSLPPSIWPSLCLLHCQEVSLFSPLIFCVSVVSFYLSTLYPKPSLMILSLLHFSFWVSSLFVPCPPPGNRPGFGKVPT